MVRSSLCQRHFEFMRLQQKIWSFWLMNLPPGRYHPVRHRLIIFYLPSWCLRVYPTAKLCVISVCSSDFKSNQETETSQSKTLTVVENRFRKTFVDIKTSVCKKSDTNSAICLLAPWSSTETKTWLPVSPLAVKNQTDSFFFFFKEPALAQSWSSSGTCSV